MITKNFKALMALILQSTGTTAAKVLIQAHDTSNQQWYLGTRFTYYPSSISTGIRIGNTSVAGVWLGSGNTPPTEDDYILDNRITSGLSAGSPSMATGLDGDGNPYLSLTYLLTNGTASDITVREVGYVQSISCASGLGSTENADLKYLLDRTVLETPLVVPANGTAVLRYILKTII